MIAIIDYEMGNLKSVSKALEHVGADVCVTRDPQKIKNADKLVLPGVGAFSQCMENLKRYDLVDLIIEEIKKGKWFLGICLGFQLLYQESDEFGPTQGLGVLRGKVKRFTGDLKIPHMGWNQIVQKNKSSFLAGVEEGAHFYFVHSYYVIPSESETILTLTDYGVPFCSAIQKDNIIACQFHPEKSQSNGLTLLKNFSKL